MHVKNAVYFERITGFILQIKNHLNHNFSWRNENYSSKAPLKISFFFTLSIYQPRAWASCVSVVWVVVSVLMCREGEAVSPCQTDGYQQGSREWVLLYSGAKRLSCNLHCLSLIFPSLDVPFIFCVCMCSFAPFALLCVNISVHDKGTEGACWLVCVSVLEADTGGNKRYAGSCPAQSL